METKRNLKYFIAPPVSIPALIGWAIVVVGAILLAAGGRSLTVPGLLVLIAGFAVVVFTSGGKSTDTDLEFQISERIKNLQERSEKKNEVYEKSFLKMMKPINLRGYDFEAKEEPFYYKKGADGQNRTNYFEGCNLIFTSEKIYIFGRRFSLTDESIDAEIAGSYYYTELDKASVEEKAYLTKKGDRDVEVPYCIFTILKNDGTEALRMCVDAGADIDKYAEQITRTIATRQKELAKRAEEAAERRAAFRAKVEAEKEAVARGELREDE